MRNILQLGLHDTVEWFYLNDANWVKHLDERPQRERLPKFYAEDPEPFRYFGIDVSPGSVNTCYSKFKGQDNTHFIACGVGSSFSVETVPNRYYNDEELKDWYKFCDEKENVLFIFMPLKFIIDQLGITDLTALVMDIDGYELDAISDIHTWDIKPEFISFEMYMPDPPLVTEMILEHAGYIHIGTYPQYTAAEVADSKTKFPIQSLHEYHYLHRDVYVEHWKSIEIKHTFYNERFRDTFLSGVRNYGSHRCLKEHRNYEKSTLQVANTS